MQFLALGGIVLFLIIVSKGMASEKITTKIPSGTSVPNIADIIVSNSKRYNVPTALIKAIIENESSWDVNGTNPNDPSYGLMGIMPIVAQDYGIVADWHYVTDLEIAAIYIPQNNIGCGTKLLGRLLKSHPMSTAVEMYNVGERGYEELGRRNSSYRIKVMDDYQKYLNEENNV